MLLHSPTRRFAISWKARLYSMLHNDRELFEQLILRTSESLLFEPVPYETAIKALNTVLESGLFTDICSVIL